MMTELKYCDKCEDETKHTMEALPPTDKIMEVNGDNPIEYA